MSSDTNSNKPKKKVRDAWMIFSSGAMAAMTGGMVTHPIDLIKVRAQLYGSKDGFGLGSSHTAKNETPNMLRIGRDVLKKEGVTGIYRGLSASLMRQATFIGTKVRNNRDRGKGRKRSKRKEMVGREVDVDGHSREMNRKGGGR